MTGEPSFDDLERGHVVLAPDPFSSDGEATRPWVVANNERHPFDKQQYIVLAMTTRTWYDERVPLEPGDYRQGRAPRDSAIVPHAVASLGPTAVTDYVCRVRDGPIDRAIERLVEYL